MEDYAEQDRIRTKDRKDKRGSKSELNYGLSLLASKKKRCHARIKELKNDENKTAFHSNGIFAEQLKIMVINEIVAEFKAAR